MTDVVASPWLLAGLYLLIVNWGTFELFGWDKRSAQTSLSRVPETLLIVLAVIGGSAGAKVGKQWFRHKTRKQPFALHLNLVVLLHILLVGLATWVVAAGDKVTAGTALGNLGQ